MIPIDSPKTDKQLTQEFIEFNLKILEEAKKEPPPKRKGFEHIVTPESQIASVKLFARAVKDKEKYFADYLRAEQRYVEVMYKHYGKEYLQRKALETQEWKKITAELTAEQKKEIEAAREKSDQALIKLNEETDRSANNIASLVEDYVEKPLREKEAQKEKEKQNQSPAEKKEPDDTPHTAFNGGFSADGGMRIEVPAVPDVIGVSKRR